jgi:hypothetical protein
VAESGPLEGSATEATDTVEGKLYRAISCDGFQVFTHVGLRSAAVQVLFTVDDAFTENPSKSYREIAEVSVKLDIEVASALVKLIQKQIANLPQNVREKYNVLNEFSDKD